MLNIDTSIATWCVDLLPVSQWGIGWAWTPYWGSDPLLRFAQNRWRVVVVDIRVGVPCMYIVTVYGSPTFFRPSHFFWVATLFTMYTVQLKMTIVRVGTYQTKQWRMRPSKRSFSVQRPTENEVSRFFKWKKMWFFNRLAGCLTVGIFYWLFLLWRFWYDFNSFATEDTDRSAGRVKHLDRQHEVLPLVWIGYEQGLGGTVVLEQ